MILLASLWDTKDRTEKTECENKEIKATELTSRLGMHELRPGRGHEAADRGSELSAMLIDRCEV